MRKIPVTLATNCYDNTTNVDKYIFVDIDKHIFIIFNEVPKNDCKGLFINKSNSDIYVEISINEKLLNKTKEMFDVAFCTVPLINLHEDKFISEWSLIIYDSFTMENHANIELIIKNIGRYMLLSNKTSNQEHYKGVFFDNKC